MPCQGARAFSSSETGIACYYGSVNLRSIVRKTFDLPADLAEAMARAREAHGVNWTAVVRNAIQAELARLAGTKQRGDPKHPKAT